MIIQPNPPRSPLLTIEQMMTGALSPEINAVGVELEGAWFDSPSLDDGYRHDDGSVEVPQRERADEEDSDQDSGGYEWVGEYVSKPIAIENFEAPEGTDMPHEPGSNARSVYMEEWLRRRWPDDSNDSCGMHFHVSFKSGAVAYQKIMSRGVAFAKYLEANLREWGNNRPNGKLRSHSFWNRLDGNNDLLTRLTSSRTIQQQVVATDKGPVRYRHVNFCWSLRGQHGPDRTMEVRVLPMFQMTRIGIEALRVSLVILSNFLGPRAGAVVTTRRGVSILEAEQLPVELIPQEITTVPLRPDWHKYLRGK